MSELVLTLRQPAQMGDRAREDFVLGTLEHVPGTVVRGAFAGAWLARNGASAPGTPERAEFLRLFEGGVRFGPLLRPGTEFLPLSVVTHKYAEQDTCAEVEYDRALTGEAPLRCPDCGSPLEQVKVLRGQRPPVRRRTSVSIGGSGVARRGVLFTRETLEAGQEFRGTLAADDPALLAILAGLGPIRVGGRRTTHGRADVAIRDGAGSPPLPTAQRRDDGMLVIRLRSPGIFTDPQGRPSRDPDPAELDTSARNSGARGAPLDPVAAGRRLARGQRPAQARGTGGGGRLDLCHFGRTGRLRRRPRRTGPPRAGPSPARGVRGSGSAARPQTRPASQESRRAQAPGPHGLCGTAAWCASPVPPVLAAPASRHDRPRRRRPGRHPPPAQRRGYGSGPGNRGCATEIPGIFAAGRGLRGGRTDPVTTLSNAAPAPAELGLTPHVRSVSFIVFILRFAEPGGVTVPGGPDQRAHLLLDTDPEGRPQLPGTSLAGALREMVRADRGEDAAAELFGRLLPPGNGADVDAQASQIWVLGSRPASVPPGEVRASTKISRSRAAAEANTLRTEEVLPAGSRFEVFLRWDDAPAGAVREFAGRLAAWRPLIGRGVSRGRGRCTAEDVRYGSLDLSDPDDLLRWLTMSGPDLARAVATEEAEVPVDAAGAGAAAAGHDVDRRAVPDRQRRGTARSADPDLPRGGGAGAAR